MFEILDSSEMDAVSVMAERHGNTIRLVTKGALERNNEQGAGITLDRKELRALAIKSLAYGLIRKEDLGL